LNFSAALGLSLFLSGCHFRADFLYHVRWLAICLARSVGKEVGIEGQTRRREQASKEESSEHAAVFPRPLAVLAHAACLARGGAGRGEELRARVRVRHTCRPF
jgi:hypothetical protein